MVLVKGTMEGAEGSWSLNKEGLPFWAESGRSANALLTRSKIAEDYRPYSPPKMCDSPTSPTAVTMARFGRTGA